MTREEFIDIVYKQFDTKDFPYAENVMRAVDEYVASETKEIAAHNLFLIEAKIADANYRLRARNTVEDIKNLQHALEHLKANQIDEEDSGRGWYLGNQKHFVARHKKSIEFIKKLIAKGE